MRGFDIEMTKKSKAANGGMVRGKGTGTSDSIKKDARVGSYIMPADSTEAIGEQTLAGMGKKVPVAVSNGEFEMPPEQVHAIGVQALDQIKNATHTPIARGLPGYTPQNQEPRQFFASGGAVDDMSRWQAASDALRQSNDRIAASQGRVNMQAPDGRFDEAKLEQAANMVQQSRLRMGTQAPVSNPNGSMNMQRVSALSNMVADSRARGFAPEAARQYQENKNKATAIASNDQNRLRGSTGYQPRQFFSGGGDVIDPKRPNWTYYQAPEPQPTRAVAVDTRPNFTIPPNEPPRPSTRIDTSSAQDTKFISDRGPGNPNTGGASKMSKEAQAFMAQRSGAAAPSAAPLGAAPVAPSATTSFGSTASKVRGLAPGVLRNTGRVSGALAALPEAVDVANVALDKNATGLDVATQSSEGVGRWASATAGGLLGSKAGAALGAFGGPAAPVTVPIGAAIGGIIGGGLGYFGADKAIKSGRELVGSDAASPIDRVNAANAVKVASPSAVAPEQPTNVNTPVDEPNAPEAANSTSTVATELPNGVYQHGRGQYSDNPNGMGFSTGFTGQPSAQNMAAMDVLAARNGSAPVASNAVRGLPSFDPSTIQHSGNSWEARNNLRNLQVGMNSMRSTNASRAAGLAAYKSALDADARARGAENEAGITAMRENAAIARTGMSEAGANQRAADNNALEAQRIGIAGQEAVFNRSLKGFDVQSAQRKQYIQSLMDAATTPEDRKAIAERFPDVYGRDSKTKMQFDVIRGKNDPITGAYSGDYAVAFDPATGTIQRMDIGGASQPDTPIPQVASQRVVGQIYTAPNGQKVKWDGKGLLPV